MLAGGELILPFQLQFQLDLVQFLLQALVLREQSITASPFGINSRVHRPLTQLLLIRQQHQRPQRRPTQMRTVADVRTVVFMSGVKTELHRHPSRMPKLQAPTNSCQDQCRGTKLLLPNHLRRSEIHKKPSKHGEIRTSTDSPGSAAVIVLPMSAACRSLLDP